MRLLHCRMLQIVTNELSESLIIQQWNQKLSLIRIKSQSIPFGIGHTVSATPTLSNRGAAVTQKLDPNLPGSASKKFRHVPYTPYKYASYAPWSLGVGTTAPS